MILSSKELKYDPNKVGSLLHLDLKPVISVQNESRHVVTADCKVRSKSSPMSNLYQESFDRKPESHQIAKRNSKKNPSIQSKSRIITSKFGYEQSTTYSKSGSANPRNRCLETQNFHLYKPQILCISPRSKIKIYSKINLTINPPKRPNTKTSNLRRSSCYKPIIISPKNHDDNNLNVKEPVEYIKPAITFGEKLWRLNEILVFSLLKK